jgi:hypothetical protein
VLNLAKAGIANKTVETIGSKLDDTEDGNLKLYQFDQSKL